ncbi:FecR family protein [Sphingobacterium sp.]|uniref:FecR family protein n=1 Tax=Sphingobacterium sp. TaxID=341027 RepID=UPI0031D40894
MKIEKDILQRYSSGQCSDDERSIVETWFDQYNLEKQVTEKELDTVVAALDKRIGVQSRNTRVWYSAAAAAIIGVFVASYMYTKSLQHTNPRPNYTELTAIKAPKKGSPSIILEDQSSFILDDFHSGDTTQIGKYTITKLSSGEIRYLNMPDSADPIYHTIKVPIGTKAGIQLADGSTVWLNANAELKYTANPMSKREVALQGEAYFEISPASKQPTNSPFYVRGQAQTIKVLGTKFDANFGEQPRTALLEGKIAFANKGTEINSPTDIDYGLTMLPNQLYDGKQLKTVDHIAGYIDWKDDNFNFTGLNLKEIAQKLSSWYDVTIVVEPSLEKNTLYGKANRQKDLIVILQMINKIIPIRYELKDNKVYISDASK